MALQVPANLVAEALRLSVKGQDHVVPKIADLLINGESGYSPRGRPKGTFLFLGPTGVGKTEITKAMSEVLFGHSDLETFDMGRYPSQDNGDVFKDELAEFLSKSIKDGDVQGLLLFDEIEKAHKTIVDLFLSITDEARFVHKGTRYDLSKCYIVCTSNLGCKEIIEMKESDISSIERFAKKAASDYFRPEGLVRFKNISVFNLLGFDVQKIICRGMVNKYGRFLKKERNMELEMTNSAVLYLLNIGVDQRLGARPLLNVIEREIPKAIINMDLRENYDVNSREKRKVKLSIKPNGRGLKAETAHEKEEEILKEA